MPAATDATLSAFHPDLIAAIRDEAARAADRVAEFLRAFANRGAAVPPISRDALLELSAILTLTAWERGGLALGRGLVSGHARGSALTTQVLGLFIERTTWAARPHLNADVRLDVADEDAFVEALAQYLWAHHACPESEETP